MGIPIETLALDTREYTKRISCYEAFIYNNKYRQLDSSSSQWDTLLANKKPMILSLYSVHFNFPFNVFSFHYRQDSSIETKCFYLETMTTPGADHDGIGIGTKQFLIHRDM